MPPRKYFRRKPRAKKPARKSKGKLSTNTKASFDAVYTVRSELVMAIAQAGNAGMYAYSKFSPNNETAISIQNCQEFLVQSRLYDEFCIRSMTVTYEPNMTNNPMSGASPFTGQASQNKLYTWIDRDGGNSITTAADAIVAINSYDSVKVTSILRKVKRTVRCKPFWIDTNYQVLNPAFAAGLAQPWVNSGNQQVVSFYSQKLPFSVQSTSLGSITTTYRVSYRGKKSVNLTYDAATGAVIMVPLSSFAPLPVTTVPRSVEDVLVGELTCGCDASGNLQITSSADGTTAVANLSEDS